MSSVYLFWEAFFPYPTGAVEQFQSDNATDQRSKVTRSPVPDKHLTSVVVSRCTGETDSSADIKCTDSICNLMIELPVVILLPLRSVLCVCWSLASTRSGKHQQCVHTADCRTTPAVCGRSVCLLLRCSRSSLPPSLGVTMSGGRRATASFDIYTLSLTHTHTHLNAS